MQLNTYRAIYYLDVETTSDMIECREIVDGVKAEAREAVKVEGYDESKMEYGCKDCMDLQAEFMKNPGGKPPRRMGLIIAGMVGGLGLGVTAITIPFLLPALRRVCLPFVPATTTQVYSTCSEELRWNKEYPK